MDEPEFEVTDIGQQPRLAPSQHHRFPGLRVAARWRLVLAAVSLVVALAVLVRVWLPLHTAEPTTLGFPSPTPRPTATAVLLPTPLPVIGLVGPPPQTCPGTPALDTITVPAFDGFIGSTVQMSGRAPVWVPEFTLPQGLVDLGSPSPTPYWPAAEIFWAIGPKSYPTVTVRAVALDTGEMAWWSLGGEDPEVPVLVMSPSLDEPTAVSWVTYRTFLIITHSGCYKLQVSWAGGDWSTIFAAGRISAVPPA